MVFLRICLDYIELNPRTNRDLSYKETKVNSALYMEDR